MVRHEDDILKAVKADLNKPEFEAKRAEVGLVLSEIDFAVKNLAEWAAPKEVETPSTHAGAKSYIYQDPYWFSSSRLHLGTIRSNLLYHR